MKIAIIGTGPSGSYAAYLVKKQGHSVEVFEKNTKIGGRTLSHRQDGFTHDTGAAFITNFYKRVFERAPELGLEEKLVKLDSINAFSREGLVAGLDLTSTGSFVRFPFLSIIDKARLAAWVIRNSLKRSHFDLSDPETLIDDDVEDVMTFGRRVVGKNNTEVILRSSVEPFWFFKSNETSIALVKALSAHAAGSSLYVLKGGIDQICRQLLEGIDVRLDMEVEQVEIEGSGVTLSLGQESRHYDRVIIATTASQAERLISEDTSNSYPAPLLDLIRSQDYSANIHACFKIPLTAESTQYRAVIPCNKGYRPLGDISFHRDKRTGNEPEHEELFSVSISDEESRKMMEISEADCFNAAWALARELVDFLPERATPFHLARRMEAIPMQRPGQYRKAVLAQNAQQNARLPVRFCGDYFTLPWIEGALASAESALINL